MRCAYGIHPESWNPSSHPIADGGGACRRGGANGGRDGEGQGRTCYPEPGLAAAVGQAAVAAGMGDGGAERDRGPKRREEPGGRSGCRGEHRGAEDLRADTGSTSPREIAGTSASSPAGSRESGGDSDGQQALGETDHCRRILVRGKGTAVLGHQAAFPGASDLPYSVHLSAYILVHSFSSSSCKYSECLLCAGH